MNAFEKKLAFFEEVEYCRCAIGPEFEDVCQNGDQPPITLESLPYHQR